jgi:DNA invertase Pin-like site-specific DNA recombinase
MLNMLATLAEYERELIVERVTAGIAAARQNGTRLGFSHRYRALGRDELLFVLDRHWQRLGRTLNPDDFTDAQAIAAIERITRGNFRLLERLFPQIGRVLKINQLETITDDVVEAAASILVIGT